MAVDVTQQAYQAIQQVVQKILGGREEAAAYAEDPPGYLASEGLADYDLSSVNLQQAVQQAAYEADLPANTKQALQQAYNGGGGGTYAAPATNPAPGQSYADHLVQHVNHVTHATYEGDDYITQQLINQENYDYSSYSDVNLEGKFYGDVEVDASTVTATDGGIAATDYANVVGATGDNAVAAGEDAKGVATGDGAVAAGEDIEGAINTGEFTGAQAGDDIGTSVVGDNNTTVADVEDSNINFGGDQSVVQDSHLEQSAVGGGNVQTSEVNIDADDGSAVAFGAGSKATGSQDDIDAYNSNVQTGDGYANQANETNQVDAYQSQVVNQAGSGEHEIDVDNEFGNHHEDGNGYLPKANEYAEGGQDEYEGEGADAPTA